MVCYLNLSTLSIPEPHLFQEMCSLCLLILSVLWCAESFFSSGPLLKMFLGGRMRFNEGPPHAVHLLLQLLKSLFCILTVWRPENKRVIETAQGLQSHILKIARLRKKTHTQLKTICITISPRYSHLLHVNSSHHCRNGVAVEGLVKWLRNAEINNDSPRSLELCYR